MTMNPETLGRLRGFLAKESFATAHATIRAVGGLTRYRIMTLLDKYPSGLTATDLTEIFDASPSKISHQIHILRKHSLIVGHKRGTMVVYQLNEKNAKRFL